MWLVRVEGKKPKSMWWNNEVKAVVRRRKCCQLAIKRQKKEVWKLTEKKRERLKSVYIRAKKKSKLTIWKEDE